MARTAGRCGQHGRCVQRGRLRLVAGSRWTAPARPRGRGGVAARDQVDYLARAVEEGGPLAYLEPERLVQAYTAPPTEPGARDRGKTGADRAQESLTWGLQAIGVQDSAATGAGIRVAVLDTGFTSDHPDFADRDVEVRSFWTVEDASDGHRPRHPSSARPPGHATPARPGLRGRPRRRGVYYRARCSATRAPERTATSCPVSMGGQQRMRGDMLSLGSAPARGPYHGRSRRRPGGPCNGTR